MRILGWNREKRLLQCAVRTAGMFCLAASAGTVCAQQVPQSGSKIENAFAGNWKGTLEYRDYTSNKRVVLPVGLKIHALHGPGDQPKMVRLMFDYIYDDGPGKTVTSSSEIDIDYTNKKSAQWVILDPGDKSKESLTIEKGISVLITTGYGRLLLAEVGMDDNKKADIRKTVDIQPNSFDLLKEVRFSGEKYTFRNRYHLVREQ
jgi:hypothetical protein